jgi:diguanylate cyclase (GGDEF)-like protein
VTLGARIRRWSRLGAPGPRRFPVAGRLALIFCGLAIFSTVFTLILQERVLDRDLERAARTRLDRSARAADQLLREHLRSVAERYAAVSRTPELRANLEIGHSETLVFFAEQLRLDQGATLVLFHDKDAKILAWSGAHALARSLPAALRQLGEVAATACIEIDGPSPQAGRSVPARPYRACRHPRGGVEATLMVVGASSYTVVAIPLQTSARRVGALIVAEAVGEDLLKSWSDLCGANVSIGSRRGDSDLTQTAASFPSGDLSISSSLGTERLALRRSRRNLVLAGLLALAAALAASLVLARSLSRPLRALQKATDAIRRGDLSIQLESDRNDELGDLSHAFGSMRDRLEESQSRLRRVQQLARFGEWNLRFDTGVVEGSPEFHRALGLPESSSVELCLTEMLERIHPEDRTALRREIERCGEIEGTFELQVRSLTAGETCVLLFRGRSQGGKGDPLRLEGSVQDLTEKILVEEQIRYLSYHDPVTGLGNTRFLRERLVQSCRGSRRGNVVVMLIGMDRLRSINETHGHSFGDGVISGTASRLLDALLAEDGKASAHRAVAHLGGGEFAVLFEDVSSPDMANAVAEQLLDRLSHPHRVQGEEIVVTASIGICFGSPAEHSPEALLRNCDSALNRAKDGGGNHIEFFDEGVRQETSRRLKIDNLLRRAHEQGRLEVHYQPRVAAQTGSILGFEALLRLTDDELGVVSPAEFIPIAEQTGLIQSIGSFAMTQALEQLRCWSDAGFDRTTISINLSPHQFHDDIDRQIDGRLEGLDPRRIELEVTESSLLRDEAAAIGALQRLRDRGFRIALDDFGTGYSSLSYMRRLPLDTVKIDSSFIGSMQRDRDAAAFTASIIAMVRTLRLGVVAEGVETPEQRDMLIEMGCDELQGALYSLAVPGDEALRMLAEADEKTR